MDGQINVIKFYNQYLLIILMILAGMRLFNLRIWDSNITFIDLERAILTPNEQAAIRFESWAWKVDVSAQENDAKTYAKAMYVANRYMELPVGVRQKWLSSAKPLPTDKARRQLVLYALAGALPTSDMAVLANRMDTATFAEWLVSAASRHSEKAEAIVKLIEEKGIASALSMDGRNHLATVYGDLANRKL